MPRRLTIRGALLALAAALVAGAPGGAAAQSPPAEQPEDYPDFPGRDATYYFCTACHGFKIVAAQGQTRAQWEATLATMTMRHSMPDVAGDQRRVMLDYLEKAFAPRSAPAGRQSPFAPR